MTVWIIIIIAVLIVCAAGGIYLTAAVGRWGGIRTISHGNKWLQRGISLGIIVVVFASMVMTLDLVNAVIIYLHVIGFFLLSGLVIRLIHFLRDSKTGDLKAETKESASGKGKSDIKVNAAGKVTKKSDSTGKTHFYWQGWMALVYSILYLSVAYYLCVNVWQTDYSLSTDKSIGTLKVAAFADSHVGAVFDGYGFAKHMETIMQQNPDIVLVVGDYVDDGTSREDMVNACSVLGQMHPKYGVWFAYGNHDKGYYNNESRGYSAEDLDAELRKNGVHVLEDEYEIVDNICIVGRKDKKEEDRKELSEILQGVDESKYIIVMDHEPNDYEKESQTAADLVVSGHTHGGQFFPVTYLGQWFGINDKIYGYEERNNTDFIVTSGIADWEILFKTGTKSEYVMMTIQGDER